MRALILVECLVVLALAGLILVRSGQAGVAHEAEVFPASRFLANAIHGETAAYQADRGELGYVDFRVAAADGGGLQGSPRVTITRTLRDRLRKELAETEPTYVHRLVEHFLFPFLTPSAPLAYDRVWVLRRIRRDTIPWHGRPLRCWRVECIDPALDPERESVVVWMHEDVPVYGILRWIRDGHEYECTSWRPK